MDPMNAVIICVGLLLFLMVVGVPIYACLGFTGLCGMVMISSWKVAVTMLKNFPYMRAADYIMMVIPMFIVMGYIAYAAGLSKDAYTIANKWLARLPAGLAMATVMASAMFGACCGSSVACSATMGKVSIPEMTEKGYNPKVSAGVVAAGGLLGIMIPPSTILVFYGTLAEVSVGQMLLAGVIPGIVTAIIYCGGLLIWSHFDKTLCPSAYKVSWKEKIWSLRLVWGVAVLFAIIIGGIYGGVVTPTEAAAIGAVACFIMMLLKTPRAERKYIKVYMMEALKETVSTCGMIFMILISSALFSIFMTQAGVPTMVNNWASGLPLPPLGVVAIFLAILIPMGMFLDPFSCLVITVPITYPVVIGTFGFDPLWYGILLTLMIQIGLITPPVGLNAYVMKGACPELALEDIFKGCYPFVFFTLVVVAVMLFAPQLATWLPYSISK